MNKRESVRMSLDAIDAQLQATVKKLEEAVNFDINTFWGLSPQQLGVGDQPNFYPPPANNGGMRWLDRRKDGSYIPAYMSEGQLSLYRKRIRYLVLNNEIAINACNVRQSYAVGRGFTYEVVPAREDVPSWVVDDAQAVVDAFCELNEMPFREKEILGRMDVDGEAFLRLFPQDNGIIEVRDIEPEYVRSPDGSTGADSYGIITKPKDVETVLGYWIADDMGIPPQRVDCDEVIHFKHPETPRTSKRGLSAFYPIETTLTAVEDLLQSTVALAKARAKIAWFRRMRGAITDVASALVTAQATVTGTDTSTGKQLNIEQYPYGSILTIPESMDIEMPSANINAGDHVGVMSMVLRIIAARFSMPEYMLTSDASNGNYSSTLVAESPFVHLMEGLQDHLAFLLGRNKWSGAKQSLIWRQLTYASRIGLLPPNIDRLVKVQVTGAPLTVRDKLKDAQVDTMYNKIGVKSKKTIQLEQGLDPDIESENFKMEPIIPTPADNPKDDNTDGIPQ